jgi:hypothetical protein
LRPVGDPDVDSWARPVGDPVPDGGLRPVGDPDVDSWARPVGDPVPDGGLRPVGDPDPEGLRQVAEVSEPIRVEATDGATSAGEAGKEGAEPSPSTDDNSEDGANLPPGDVSPSSPSGGQEGDGQSSESNGSATGAQETREQVPSEGVSEERDLPKRAADPPQLDGSGKVHTHGSELPSHIPDHWTADELEDLEHDLGVSIETRKMEQIMLGEDGPHRLRIYQEERLLEQVKKRLSGS